MSVDERSTFDDSALVPAYARLPVEFVRGEGARLWDADGVEYLDVQTGLAVNSLGHCHPAVVEAIRAQAARLIHVGNLFHTAPGEALARAPGRVVARRPRALRQLRHRGQRGRDQDGAQGARAAATIVSVHRGFHGRTYGVAERHAAGVQAGAVRAAGARASWRSRRPPRRSPRRSTSAPRPCSLEPIQGESGVYELGAERRCARPARPATRPARR